MNQAKANTTSLNMAAKKSRQKPAQNTETTQTKASGAFTAEERAAMRDHVKEIRGSGKDNDEEAVLAKIAGMSASDRAMAERVHAIVKTNAPELSPRLWYGMPAYARNGKVVCFFQDSTKFKTRYSTLGFSDLAKLDDGNMWPSAFALKELMRADEERIAALVKRAVG